MGAWMRRKGCSVDWLVITEMKVAMKVANSTFNSTLLSSVLLLYHLFLVYTLSTLPPLPSTSAYSTHLPCSLYTVARRHPHRHVATAVALAELLTAAAIPRLWIGALLIRLDLPRSASSPSHAWWRSQAQTGKSRGGRPPGMKKPGLQHSTPTPGFLFYGVCPPRS